MNRTNQNPQHKSHPTKPRPQTPTSTSSFSPQPEIEPAAAANQAKQFLSPDAPNILALQRTMGNKAIQRLIGQRQSKVQRHWMPGEQEEVQAMPAIQRHWMPGEEQEIQAKRLQRQEDEELQETPAVQRVAMSRSFGMPGYVQRRAIVQETINHHLWSNAAAHRPIQREDGKTPEAPAPEAKTEAKSTPITFTSPITFDKTEIPADGKTTAQAQVKFDPAGSTIKWELDGERFGSSISDGGLVTPGSDLKGNESAKLQVKVVDSKTPTNATTGFITLWDAKLFQAKIDYPKFVAGTYSFPNFRPYNFGKFDVEYVPAGNVLNANMRVKFEFPDDPVTPPSARNLWGFFGGQERKAVEARHKTYITNFINQVTTQWSGRYQFKNVREPQSIWGKLNPISVNLKVEDVESNQHFLIKAYTKTAGTANVTGGGVTSLYKGDDVPKPAFNPGTAQGELTRVRRNTPTPILFANNTTDVPGTDLGKLQFLGTYLSRINNPKFDIKIDGYASKTGDSAKNQALSQSRADNVANVLRGAGVAQHNLAVNAHGDSGSTADAGWRKVEIASDIPVGWQNFQDVTAHEFGHMLGLDDEYAAGRGPLAEHHDLVAKAFGKEYADQVAKAGDTDYGSVMEGGSDVRIQHYVTFWQGLVESTLKGATPDPKFGWDDWKFIG